MTKKTGNSLQAILKRASADGAQGGLEKAAPAKARRRAAPVEAKASGEEAQLTASGRAVQRNRVGMKMIGGHFPLEVSAQLRILAAEENTTVQRLLEEAIADLLTKKAARKVGR